MKRRATWLALLCTVALFTEQAAWADPEFQFRLAQTWPAKAPLMAEAPALLAERVEQMSGGRLIITVDAANKHKAPLEIFDLVKSGRYDMGHSASYYWKGKDPNTQYFTTMPFGMIAPEQIAWFYHGGGRELMEKVYAPYGVLSFPGGNSGNQMGGWFRQEITSVEDLEGLKMRIPGFAGEIMAKVGAAPTNVAPGELYTALERNTIDALEWVGPALDLRMGFQKVASHYYTGWHEPGAELQFLINEQRFKELPSDLQQILVIAMRLVAYDTYIHFYHENAMELARLKSEFPEVQIKAFPPEVLHALREARDQLLAERTENDPLAREIVESLNTYEKKARAWTEISDKAYLNSLNRKAK